MAASSARSLHVLSGLIAALAGVASAGGLLVADLYRDNLWATTQWIGNDFVTLLVAVPLLVAASALSARGSLRAHLVQLGMLAYMLYGYAFYVFGAAFNPFFLLYVAILALSILALLFGAAALDVREVARLFQGEKAARGVSVFMGFWALFLGGLWTVQSLQFALTGVLPPVIEASGLHTSPVFAVDLSLMVPGLVLGAIWLWQGRPWGYVLGVVYNVKGAVYALALVGMSVSQAHAGILEEWALALTWVFFTVACLGASLLLLNGLRPVALARLAPMA